MQRFLPRKLDYRGTKQNPFLSNMGEGFINGGYIVGKMIPRLDMKGLTFSMPRLFDYLRCIPCLSRG